MTAFADVVFPVPLGRGFTYAVPEPLRPGLRPGCRVEAPFGPRDLVGFVVRVHDVPPGAGVTVKEIRAVVDPAPIVPRAMLDFTERLSRRYLSSWGELLAATLPPEIGRPRSRVAVLTEAGRKAHEEGKLGRVESAVAVLLAKKPLTARSLRRREGGIGLAAALTRMLRKGLARLESGKAPVCRPARPQPRRKPAQLELDFAGDAAPLEAAAAAALAGGRFAELLAVGPPDRRRALYGRLARLALARSRSVLALVPEGAMGPALAAGLAAAAGAEPVLLHARQAAGERSAAEVRARAARAGIFVGARNALFLPRPDLGLVVVDEEHDDAHVQSESPAFDVRAGARLRAEIDGAVLVAGSEIPSVEAFHRASRLGIVLDLDGGAPRAAATVADDSRERSLLGRALREGLRDALGAGGRAILFLNRRGYAAKLVCPGCGYVPACDRCDAALAYHKTSDRLACPRCGREQAPPRTCPKCRSRIFEPRGAGVEALEEEVRRAFPSARIARFDGDRAVPPAAREKAAAGFARGRLDVLIGTQLLARRTDVPPAAFVGIVGPEALLCLPDYGAAERAFRAIWGMLRFAALGEERGRAVVQTSFPGHYAVVAAARGDYGAFYGCEIEARQLMGDPPFSEIAEIVLGGRDPRRLAARARELAARLRSAGPDVQVLGPATPRAAMVKGEKRIQLTLKAAPGPALESVLQAVVPGFPARLSVTRSA